MRLVGEFNAAAGGPNGPMLRNPQFAADFLQVGLMEGRKLRIAAPAIPFANPTAFAISNSVPSRSNFSLQSASIKASQCAALVARASCRNRGR